MTTGDPCLLCDGRMVVYRTVRDGELKLRYLRCSNPECTSRGRQVLLCSEPVRHRFTRLVNSSLDVAPTADRIEV